MPLPVSLKAVVEAMEMTSDEISHYINRKTGELVMVSDEEANYAENAEDELAGMVPDWQLEAIQDAKRVLDSDDFVELPDRFEIHEWDLMRRFCDTVDDAGIRKALQRAIKGRGAFRYFKDTAHETGVIDDWYRHRDQAMREIAADFLAGQGIPFDPDKPPVEDRPGPSKTEKP